MYQPELYLSPRKCSTAEFERSFAGSLDGKDALPNYSSILASLQQDYKETFDQTNSQALGSHHFMPKFNPVHRSKIRHYDPATQLMDFDTKCRAAKDKENNLLQGTRIVEDLKELAFRHNRPKDTILAAAVNSNYNEGIQEDLVCTSSTATCISNIDSVIHFSAQSRNPTTKIFETRKAHDNQNSQVFSSRLSQQIANGSGLIEATTTLSDETSVQVEDFMDHSSDFFVNQQILGSKSLAYGIRPLPRDLTIVQQKHLVTNKLDVQENAPFDQLPRHSKFPSRLDYLISEVVHEWVEMCSTPFRPYYSACDGSLDTCTMSHHSTFSITCEAVNTKLHVSPSSPGIKWEIMNGMQVLEARKSSANEDHCKKVQGSKSCPTEFDLVKGGRKTNVAALASIAESLLVSLQEAQIEESVVTEFEADETIRLLLEKLQIYETKIRNQICQISIRILYAIESTT